eukprot:TRINITY_DN12960_c0_g1_i1.p1 TRINITY_DN12960_c0_g1~~TRINITY_DN12960_c0_g1_i1.p1  ORF type:complete len:183 (+),score=29.41 TRINITY_DN12960_c0_g1_i1:43-591(+)
MSELNPHRPESQDPRTHIHNRISFYIQSLSERHAQVSTQAELNQMDEEFQKRAHSLRHLLESLGVVRETTDMFKLIRDMDIATDTSIFVAIIYFHRFIRASFIPIPPNSIVPLLATCIYIAEKVYEDHPYNLVTYCLLSTVEPQTLRRLELEILHVLKFKLFVRHERIEALIRAFHQDVPVV